MGIFPWGEDLRGWEVRGTTLFELSNAGGSPVPFPLPVQYFALLPNNSGWLVAGQTTADNGLPTRRVFTTPDGGKSWAEHAFGEIPSNFDSPWLDGIQFADNLHGWLRGGTFVFYAEDRWNKRGMGASVEEGCYALRWIV